MLSLIRVITAPPEVLIGINQTKIIALSICVIIFLVETRDLDKEFYIALTNANITIKLVYRLLIAFIAVIAAWSKNPQIRDVLETTK